MKAYRTRSPSSHSWSWITSRSGFPSISQNRTSGTIVGEWLPQIPYIQNKLQNIDSNTINKHVQNVRIVHALWTWVGWTPAFLASWKVNRLWSRRVSAEKFSWGMLLHCDIAINAFVFAGFPTYLIRNTYTNKNAHTSWNRKYWIILSKLKITTTILQSFLADLSKAWPCSTKILPFCISRSPRSMPGPLGTLPTKHTLKQIKMIFRLNRLVVEVWQLL